MTFLTLTGTTCFLCVTYLSADETDEMCDENKPDKVV